MFALPIVSCFGINQIALCCNCAAACIGLVRVRTVCHAMFRQIRGQPATLVVASRLVIEWRKA